MSKLQVIYEPKGPAREYAALALNLYNGCTHACIYCYNDGRYSKKDGSFFLSAKPRMGLARKIAHDAGYLIDKYGDECPEVLISFIGDAYQKAERNLGVTRLAIRILIDAGVPFTILTKSDLIQRDFDILAPYRDKFRLGMTILTTFEDEAEKWEPGAPWISERLDTLRVAKSAGIKTWVSLEPVMKVQSAVKLIHQYYGWVDLWHIGKLNHMEPPQPIDWMEAMRDITAALDQHKCKYKFKRSFTDL